MEETHATYTTMTLPDAYDEFAPDGAEIRVLGHVAGASMAHGTLPPGAVSLPVAHRTVEEIWYVLGGRAEVWRRQAGVESVVLAEPGTSLTIPLGTAFQYRTVGKEPFTFIMCTVPPWPGEDEAFPVAGHWSVPE